MTIIYPDFYRVFERRDNRWFIKVVHWFYKPIPIDISPDELKILHGLSNEEVIEGLKSVNGAQKGFYLANLKDCKYYYCGESAEGVKSKLRSLGIGRDDPNP